MTIRTKDKVVIKNSKMEKKSYIFLAHCRNKSMKLLYTRIVLKPISTRAVNCMNNHRHANNQQFVANPRMMQHFWGVVADNKESISYLL